MLDFLDKLRSKPIHVRKQIALVTTSALSFVILSAWLGSGFLKPATIDLTQKQKEISPTEVVLGAILDLKNNASAQWKETAGQIQYVSKQNVALAGAADGNATATNVVGDVSQTTEPIE